MLITLFCYYRIIIIIVIVLDVLMFVDYELRVLHAECVVCINFSVEIILKGGRMLLVT